MKTGEFGKRKVCQQIQEARRNTAYGDSIAQKETEEKLPSYQNGWEVMGGEEVSYLKSIKEIILISSNISELDTQCLTCFHQGPG